MIEKYREKLHKVDFGGLHFKKAGAIIRSVKEKQIPHRKDLPGGIECMTGGNFYETGRKKLNRKTFLQRSVQM